jgi:hypothetical protein
MFSQARHISFHGYGSCGQGTAFGPQARYRNICILLTAFVLPSIKHTLQITLSAIRSYGNSRGQETPSKIE